MRLTPGGAGVMWLLMCGSLAVLTATSTLAGNRPLGIGGQIGYQTPPDWTFLPLKSDLQSGVQLTYRPTGRWWLDASVRLIQFDDDALTVRTSLNPADSLGLPIRLKGNRYALMLSYSLIGSGAGFHLPLGIGVGLLDWRVTEQGTGNKLTTRNSADLPVPFSATELLLSARTGVTAFFGRTVSISLFGEVDYLTGAGTDFRALENDQRETIAAGGNLQLSLWLGRSGARPTVWKSEQKTANKPPVSATHPKTVSTRPDQLDSDADGIIEERDRCPGTPRGAVVTDDGCPVDGDKDGVPDGIDDCPGTVPAARSAVDQFGCPRDLDLDGSPDFQDACPDNLIGAEVDSLGCPVDSDKDGVPDGLDDCPETMFGMEVDQHGCLDVTSLRKPLVLNINYQSGSFEIDPKAKERLRRLANLLSLVPQFRLEIAGYTDNIGTDEANQQLSEKRARRVLDFLAANGVATDRMSAIGRGEIDPVADNQTAEGRTKNRRIVIQFFEP